MTTVATYLVITLVCGVVAVLIRLPPLVGFLAAGFVLNGVGVERFPALELLADLGVTLLLFGIGLKLDPRTLLRKQVWLTAVAHMALSTLAAVGVVGLFVLLGVGILAGADLVTMALIGFALSFSSTVLAVKVLADRSEMQSLYGRIVVGILVMQDIAAVIFITASTGHLPSPWAFALVLLFPGARVFRWVWARVGHGELQLLFGIAMALVPGYTLFTVVGLKGDLGALIIGMLLAGDERAGELARDLLGLRELLLVGFFVSIGFYGLPNLADLAVAALLLLQLPLQFVVYFGLLHLMRFRLRTSMLSALALSNFSEFALIVGAVAAGTGLLEEHWMVVLSVAVAFSFVISALVNRMDTDLLVQRLTPRFRGRTPEELHPDDRPIDVGRAEAVVLGMGRVGRGAYRRLENEYGMKVVGIDNDPDRTGHLRHDGLDVEQADITDRDFWDRLESASALDVAVLALPTREDNLLAIEQLTHQGFRGATVAVAQFTDEVKQLSDAGADEVFHLYAGAGIALADAAVKVAMSDDVAGFDGPPEGERPPGERPRRTDGTAT